MAELLDNLKPWQFAYIETAMLLPTVVSGVLFWYYGFPMIALIVTILFCYLVVPLFYIQYDKVSTHNMRIGSTMAKVYLDTREQLKFGGIWFGVSGLTMFIILFFTLKYCHFWQFTYVNYLWLPNTEIIVFSILLVLLDPFAEEFFWRLFVQSAFKGGITYSDPDEMIIWYIAVHYGVYYMFIFAVITQHFWQAVLCALPFVFFSRKLSYVRTKGLVAAVLAHTGMNLAIVIVLNLWYWNKWTID